MYKKITSFFSKHVMFNSTLHLIAGIGIGSILTYPLFASHPVRWGLGLLLLALLGHIYALKARK